MIVDFHHHLIPTFPEEAVLTAHAQFYHKAYGAGARSKGANVSLEEIQRRLQSYTPDPDGEKLLRRMSRAGIDVTVMCVTDNIQPRSAGYWRNR